MNDGIEQLRDLNNELLEALQAIVNATELEVAQEIACDAIAIAMTKIITNSRKDKS